MRVVVFGLVANWSLACAIAPTSPSQPSGDSPTPCTLIVEIGILDIHLADPVEFTRSNTSFVKSWGQASIYKLRASTELVAEWLRSATSAQARP